MGEMDWTDAAIGKVYALFGERVRRERGRKRLTQAQLALAAGLTRSSVANIEAGRQRIQLHSLFMLADALEVSESSLMPEKAEIAKYSEPVSIPDYDLQGQPETTQEFVSEAIRRTIGE